MRRTTIGLLAFSAFAIAGCGSSGQSASRPRPPVPVNLTVYINNQRVLVSPRSVGAGPVIFTVTNQSTRTQTLAIHGVRSITIGPIATGPITPQGTAQVQVNFRRPGVYTLTSIPVARTQAARAVSPGIRAAALRIGRPRPSADNVLLLP
jgi:hypothetical protein